jgi:peptidoglycan/LPS O-acetylase OafA/YrhL
MPDIWPLGSVLVLIMGCLAYALQFCSLGIVLWSVGLAPLLAFATERDFSVLSESRVLKALGQFSYTLYAVHFPILVLASAVVCGGIRQPDMVLTLGLTALTVAASYGVYWLAERPSLRLLETMRR